MLKKPIGREILSAHEAHALKKRLKVSYVKKTYRQGNSKRPRSYALKKDRRQAIVKKTMGTFISAHEAVR